MQERPARLLGVESTGPLEHATGGPGAGPDKMSKYVICRVLGNELPPRDEPGSKLKCFQHIFKHEYVDSDAVRLWILNRIADSELLSSLKGTIEDAGERYVELHIDWTKYASCYRRHDKLSTLIGINQARNIAFENARRMGQMAIILDADCYFDEVTWNATKLFIEDDQLRNPERHYYAIPIVRLQLDEVSSVSALEGRIDEPVLAIRADAPELFDESRPFGQGDKVRFLLKLGIRNWDDKWYPLRSDGACTVGGRVIHVSAGTKNLDLDILERGEQRKRSLDLLLRWADTSAGAVILQRQGIKKYLRFKLRSDLAKVEYEIRHRLRHIRLPRSMRTAISGILSSGRGPEGGRQ